MKGGPGCVEGGGQGEIGAEIPHNGSVSKSSLCHPMGDHTCLGGGGGVNRPCMHQ